MEGGVVEVSEHGRWVRIGMDGRRWSKSVLGKLEGELMGRWKVCEF